MARNVKNIRNMSGWAYFRKSGETHFRSLGHIENLSRTIDFTREPVWTNGTGSRIKEDVITTEQAASISFVLRETSAMNMALAYASDEIAYTQEAETAVIVSGSKAERGVMIDLGYLNVESVTVTDGTDVLEVGFDYELDAAAGTVEFFKSFASYDITFDAPAIVEDDGQLMMHLMSREEGIEGELKVVQKQKRGSERFMLERTLINVTPDGDQSLISADTGAQTISLSGEVIANPLLPDGERFGRLVALKD